MKAAQNGLFAGEIYNIKNYKNSERGFSLLKIKPGVFRFGKYFPPTIIYFTFTNLKKKIIFFGRTNKLDWDLGWIHSQENGHTIRR